MMKAPDWGFASWSWFWYGPWSLVYIWSKSLLSILILKGQRKSMSLSPNLELWRTLEIPDWGLASWSWLEFGHWSLLHPWSKFWFSMWISKVQRTSMSWKSWFGALEDAGGSWLGFGIMILIFVWSLVFGTSMIQILALYLDFKGAKNIHVLIWGFSGACGFLTGVWHLDIDLDMVTGLW